MPLEGILKKNSMILAFALSFSMNFFFLIHVF